MRGLSIAYAFAILAALVGTMSRPIGFQKVNSIIKAGLPEEPARAIEGKSLDVAAVLGSIPYSAAEHLPLVWEVSPEEKYRRSILEGDGNCSSLVFGLSWGLLQSEIDFEIVHLMDPDRVLSGVGHTVVRTRYRLGSTDRVGIVDVLEGGLPQSGGRPLDVPDLTRGPVAGLTIASLNDRKDDQSPFYGALLEGVVLGTIQAAEVDRYFRFLDAAYLPLGSRRLEKYVYDGLAVLLGFYPRIQVVDHSRLVAANRGEWLWHRSALWVLRSAPIGVPVLILLALRSRR